MSDRIRLAAAVLLTPPLFGAGFFVRANAAYGPFNLSLHPADWLVLWDLLRTGQISGRVLAEAAALGTAVALVPWALYGAWRRAGG